MTMTNEKLQEVLILHKKWLNDENGGVRADLRDADLRGANLRSADLRDAKLRDADLRSADLRSADLRDAKLRDTDLRGANLRRADLSGADLSNADLSGADIDFASLTFSCKTLNIITDDRIKIQYLYHVAKQKGKVTDKDLAKLLNSKLFKKVCNKFHRVEECGNVGE